MDYRCPECDRDIVNRGVNECMYCGASNPKELLFTKEEIQENEERYKEIIETSEKEEKQLEKVGVVSDQLVLNGVIVEALVTLIEKSYNKCMQTDTLLHASHAAMRR